MVSYTCVGWREAKWAYKIDGFVEQSPSALEQKITWGFLISSLMMNSTRSPRIVLAELSSWTFWLITLKSAIVNSWITHSLKRPPLCWLSNGTVPVYSMLWKEREKMVLQSEHCSWNQWNLLHNKGFLNSERVTLSLLRTKSKWTREQEHCCAHELINWIW